MRRRWRGAAWHGIHSAVNRAALLVRTLRTQGVVSTRDDPLWNKPGKFYAACGLPCVCGGLTALLCATLLKLRKAERVAVCIETSYQARAHDET